MKSRDKRRSRVSCDRMPDYSKFIGYSRKHENHFREIGATLGDVASFMHEIQIGYGLFPDTKKTQRVESMRQVALRLQSMEEQKESKETRKEQTENKEPFETTPYD